MVERSRRDGVGAEKEGEAAFYGRGALEGPVGEVGDFFEGRGAGEGEMDGMVGAMGGYEVLDVGGEVLGGEGFEGGADVCVQWVGCRGWWCGRGWRVGG